MSIALPSPHQTGSKRFLEPSEDHQLPDADCRVPFSEFNPQKRSRHLTSPARRCGPGTGSHPAYTFGSTTLAALRALFPGMSDKVISEVLAEFGDNIDAAIKHLNELQLSAPGTSKQHDDQAKQREGIIGAAPTSAEATAADATTSNGGVGTSHPTEETRSAEQWIELLVQQMSAAGDIADAKQRAAEILRAFEQAVMQHTSVGRAAELERENALLKRAVGIQNARIQELGHKEAESVELKAVLESAKARIQALEMQNYSLQLHLKQAADAKDVHLGTSRNNPDVF